MRTWRSALILTLVVTGCLLVAEAGRRLLDGYRLFSVGLVRTVDARGLTLAGQFLPDADRLLETIPRDPEADPAWFADRPPDVPPSAPPASRVRRPPTWYEVRRDLGHDNGANYVWNINSLTFLQSYFEDVQSSLGEFFTFNPPSKNPYPRYRLYPDIQSGFGVTNHYGFRSRQITVAKPADVVRIAMLGDSTTNNHPELVERWLTHWAADAHLGVRFEIINAARPATEPVDIAAIFDEELGPFDPDYVIVYGFGNPAKVADAFIQLPPGIIKGVPASASRRGRLWERTVAAAGDALGTLKPWSAAATFLQRRIIGAHAEHGAALGAEPKKPETHVVFPPGIDEHAPDPDSVARRSGGLMMGLDWYLQSLGPMDRLAKQRGTRLFISTFRVFAYDGLLLPTNGNEAGLIYRTLNEGYWWPYTYAEIERLMAFYNRTLRAWAARTGNGVVPIDERMPRRAELYGDGMHERPLGEALHAWVVLQELMPAIRDDLRQHRLPRRSPAAPPYSEQYWKIDHTKSAEIMATIARLNDAVVRPPADVIPGAFDLAHVTNSGALELVPGSVPRFKTPAQQFGYAVSVPIDASVAASLSGRGWVDVHIKVTEGRLSIGVLDKTAQHFLVYEDVDLSPDVQRIQLNVKDLSQVGSVMITNNRRTGNDSSSGEVHDVVLQKIRSKSGREAGTLP